MGLTEKGYMKRVANGMPKNSKAQPYRLGFLCIYTI